MFKKKSMIFYLIVLTSILLLQPVYASCNQPSLVKSPLDSSRVDTYGSKWMEALSSKGVVGKTWFGKLDSNGGSDNEGLSEQGRLTIIFAPCTNDYTKPVELMYYFHGIYAFGYQKTSSGNPLYPTFDDFNTRIAPQLKELIDDQRNFILVFPELPWSGGDQGGYYSKRKSGKRSPGWRSYLWDSNGGDSDLVQFQNDVINKVRTDLNINPNVNFVSMTGQSAGGRPLHAAASKGLLDDVQVKKITFSDADYTGSTKIVYNNYVKDNPDVELNMLVQDPSRPGAHDPTKHSIALVKEIGGSATSSWSGGDKDTGISSAYSTPGAETNKVFSVPGHPNVHYVPLDLSHGAIGAMSLAWRAEDHDGSSVIPSRGSISQTSSNPVTSNVPSHMSCGSTTKCEELHKVWTKIGPIVGKNQYWKPSSKLKGQWVSDSNQLGLQTQTSSNQINPTYVSSTPISVGNCQLTSSLNSQSIGSTSSGSISNSVALISNQHIYSRSSSGSRECNFGTLELVNQLEKTACEIFSKTNIKLTVADLSLENGGETPGNPRLCANHVSHQSGRDADIGLYYYDNGRLKNALVEMCTVSNDNKCHNSPHSKWLHPEALEANWEFVKSLNKNYPVKLILLDQKLIDSLSDYANSKGESISGMHLSHSKGHHHHYHLRIECPQGDTQCSG